MTDGYALPNKAYRDVIDGDPSKVAPIPFDGDLDYYGWSFVFDYIDYRIQNAGHVRFQELALSYNVPQSFLNKLRISKATVYAQANNLFVLTNNRYNEDPEYVLGTLRPRPAYTFGINFTF